MILTHESGSQEDQFDGKKDQKSRGTVPFKYLQEKPVLNFLSSQTAPDSLSLFIVCLPTPCYC